MFVISKLLGWFTEPLNWYFLCVLVAIALLYYQKKRLAIWCLSALLLCFSAIGFTPLSSLLLGLYENQYTQPQHTQPQGIIVLGGGLNPFISGLHDDIALTAAANRLFALASFARRYPHIPIIFTGGSGALLHQQQSEADYVRQFLAQLGIHPERLLLESQSRTTYENARYTKRLLAQHNITTNQSWLLITSAYHMPRAMSTFRAHAMALTAYPVDYHTSDTHFQWNKTLNNHRLMSLFLHELLGNIAYSFYNS